MNLKSIIAAVILFPRENESFLFVSNAPNKKKFNGLQKTSLTSQTRKNLANNGLELHSKTTFDRRSAITLIPLSLVTLLPTPAKAESSEERIKLVKEVLSLLKRVPTFSIVDKDGTPFMILNKGSQEAIGYFFLTYEGAQTILASAKKSAAEGGFDDIWDDAAICTVPLNVALQLGLKVKERDAQNSNGRKFDSINDVVPSQGASNDASQIEKSTIYSTKGRVPLFYADDLRISDSEGEKKLPLYFEKNQLLAEWNSQYPETKPTVKVRDLVDTFQNVVTGNTKSLKNTVFVPPPENVKTAKDLKAKGNSPSYNFDRMIMVTGG